MNVILAPGRIAFAFANQTEQNELIQAQTDRTHLTQPQESGKKFHIDALSNFICMK